MNIFPMIVNKFYLKDNLYKYEVVHMMMIDMIHHDFDQLDIDQAKRIEDF
jgi:hypothetical protein